MRLTADALLHAETYLNPVKEREINLRGLKIAVIENIAVLQDQFDSIDLSDNEIRMLENFPIMKRLNMLIFNNNYITRIAPLGDRLTGLTHLILTNNRISNLSEIDNIASYKKLELLSLLENPVIQKENYRLYVIFKIPSLKSLDYKKVRKQERIDAVRLFESSSGQAIISGVASEVQEQAAVARRGTPAALTEDQKRQVRDAIAKASTPEEMDKIEKQLRAGTFVFIEDASLNGAIEDCVNGHVESSSMEIEEVDDQKVASG